VNNIATHVANNMVAMPVSYIKTWGSLMSIQQFATAVQPQSIKMILKSDSLAHPCLTVSGPLLVLVDESHRHKHHHHHHFIYHFQGKIT